MKLQQKMALNSYWDNRFNRQAIKLLPGDFVACQGEEMIVTVLGSCISVCLFETKLKMGGMNHFMLPEAKKKYQLLAIHVSSRTQTLRDMVLRQWNY